MRNNTINGLLRDAQTAIRRIAAADRTYPAAKAGAIVAARLAVASLLH